MDSGKTYLGQMKVLYVEDDRETLQELSTFLKRRVGRLFTAEDGITALEIFEEVRPDIVIADLLMPNMHGLDMLTTMRAKEPECRFIVTSSVNQTDAMLTAIDLGVVKYLVKPIQLQELDQVLARIAEEQMAKVRKEILFTDEDKRQLAAQIKGQLAQYMKKTSGKGPRDVSVFIHESEAEVIAYEVLSPMERKLMTRSGNRSIIEQVRRCFYGVCKIELEEIVTQITNRTCSLAEVEIHPDRESDKLVFRFD